MKKETKSYIIAVLIPLIVGGVSALLTSGNMNLYDKIIQPPLAPPPVLFPIVWTVLYVLMGISSGIIYNSKNGTAAQRNNALAVYGLQLFVNFFWSIIFFNLNAFLFSFILIIVLWLFVILMIIRFYKIDKTAAYLQIPYLLWVTFAAYLTLAIYILNR